MNQRERAAAIVRILTKASAVLSAEPLLTQLDDIIGEAQNRPPLGISDGTIDEKQWYALRDLATALRTYNEALRAAQSTTGEAQT